ncbi:MAG: hypothetical protein KAT05_03745 [Spirochaetes bacterium]|nr:hypothetical protein [Spirochaetota bacterium]
MSKPWTEGPKELIQHAIEHKENDTPFDNRLAFISIDNAVELMIKTYLGLPKRITGLTGIKPNESENIFQNFPNLLDLLEKHCADRIHGIELGDIEWYHRIRNQLYHSGNGITVGNDKVSEYLEISKILFSNLFGHSLELSSKEKYPDSLLAAFIKEWGEFEIGFFGDDEKRNFRDIMEVMGQLEADGMVSVKDLKDLCNLRNYRNSLTHGSVNPNKKDLEMALKKIKYFKEI